MNEIETLEPPADPKVVEVTEDGRDLIVVVESGSIERLIDGTARKVAWDERLKHNMPDSGVEALGGTYIPDEERAAAKETGRDVACWRRDFKLVHHR